MPVHRARVLIQFSAVAANLDLVVYASMKRDLPIGKPAPHVAGSIKPRIIMCAKGMFDKTLSAHGRIVEVALCQPRASEVDLSCLAGSYTLHCAIKNVDFRIIDRPPNRRQPLASFLRIHGCRSRNDS